MADRPAPRPACRPLVRKIDERLVHLIGLRYPDERTRPGYARLAHEIRAATGGTISGTYLWELATGKKRNLTLEQLDILAEFFEVPPEYFFNDEVAERVSVELELAAALRDAKIRSLVLRAAGLSTVALDSLLSVVSEVRRLQGLPGSEDDAGSPDSTV
ncbi:hypothetical protein NDR87_36890 [Nocardia sp. CDC159]|uniref:HTH cro/C1-type domain-containing protein n=1 Tax=Nocardia pulmonis TaxID=2951408 RepID=A0A9X2J2D4_9NOCA|nr:MULTISPECIES: hypothetical protein [Nocardia]MCM6779065.1 hypothetical protein [Nocardia pulmonis]MCM6791955.1 hypothetical protein [Nocardia sp. CDC159]